MILHKTFSTGSENSIRVNKYMGKFVRCQYRRLRKIAGREHARDIIWGLLICGQGSELTSKASEVGHDLPR